MSLRTGQSGLFAKYIRLMKGFLDKHIPSPVKYFRTYHYVYVLVDTLSTADILPELHVKQKEQVGIALKPELSLSYSFAFTVLCEMFISLGQV